MFVKQCTSKCESQGMRTVNETLWLGVFGRWWRRNSDSGHGELYGDDDSDGALGGDGDDGIVLMVVEKRYGCGMYYTIAAYRTITPLATSCSQ